MSTVSGTGNSYLDNLRGTETTNSSTKKTALEQSDYFALLTQQLAYQDPTKPVDNDQMVSQMTTFSMADGISQLNTNFKSFADGMSSNQVLQASTLVGRTVRVNSDSLVFDGTNAAYGAVEVPAGTSSMKVNIYDESGALVRSSSVDNPTAGKFDFGWDGKDTNDTKLEAGLYTMKVEATVSGKNQTLATSSYVPVSSITLGSSTSTMQLNLLGLGAKKMSDILEIAAG
ncbi:MAG TPA: flagellar biosynthesis protein FlgD [Rheinheimera sp.]|nr:flagellar biosynthesis protein FlgD [Rheinheimera sp.]